MGYTCIVLVCKEPGVQCLCHQWRNPCQFVKKSECNPAEGVCECIEDFYVKERTRKKNRCKKAPSKYLN